MGNYSPVKLQVNPISIRVGVKENRPVLILPPAPSRLLAPLRTDPIQGIGEKGYNHKELQDAKYQLPGAHSSLRSNPKPAEEHDEAKGEQKGIEGRYSPSLPRNREPTPPVCLCPKPELADLLSVFAHGIIIQYLGRFSSLDGSKMRGA